MLQLPNSNNSDRAQVFPLIYGKVNKTIGSFSDVSGIYCVADGTVQVTYENGEMEEFDFIQGDCFGFTQVVSIAIVSGKFHYA